MNETVNARKIRYDSASLGSVLSGVRSVASAKRSKIEKLEWGGKKPAQSDIELLLLGPSGNLRAPTVRVGGKLLVGFSEELYSGLG